MRLQSTGMYDWSWGTKWNARDSQYSTKDQEHAIRFDTAWSPASPRLPPRCSERAILQYSKGKSIPRSSGTDRLLR